MLISRLVTINYNRAIVSFEQLTNFFELFHQTLRVAISHPQRELDSICTLQAIPVIFMNVPCRYGHVS
jgi:hypothetical protein